VKTIFADSLTISFAAGIALGQAIILNAPAVTLVPLVRCDTLQPNGRHHRQLIQSSAHRFCHLLQAVHHPNRGQDMGGIGPLLAACFHQLQVSADGQQLL
jgi:hypothetical protein